MFILLIGIVVILFINKILMLRKELKENKKRYWPIYFSSLFAEVTSLPLIYIIQIKLIGITITAATYFLIICLVCIIENIIFFIVGIALFLTQKKKKSKEKSNTLLKILLTFLVIYLCMFLSVFIPIIYKTPLEKYIEDYVVEYMTTKYGNGDFKVTRIKKHYKGGLWSPEVHIGYSVKVKTSYIDEIITVSIDGTTKEEFEIEYDTLIFTYHKVDGEYDYVTNLQEYLMTEKLKIVENEYKKQFDIDMKFECYYEVSDDYGHLPSMNDLVNLCKINTKNISIKINDHVELKNEWDYIKRLAKYSLNYFNDEEEVNIYYTLNFRNGFIKINYSTVTIKIDETERIYSKEEIKNFTN